MRRRSARHDLGRESFVEKVWEWKEKSGNTITGQMRRLGASADWDREYFTMDEPRSKTVTEVFVRLFEQGLIYRGKRLVNWDPVLGTAVSDLEVAQEEEDGSMWYIRYPFADGSGHVTVATTRPETLLGDVAVAVDPTDERYTAPGRQDAAAAADRPRDSPDRRRVRRQGLRHGLREDHARPRLQRLRRRPAQQAAADQHPDAGREDQRERARPSTRAWTASRRASRSSPTSTRWACCRKSNPTSCRCRAATAPASSSSPC